jgi:hypothetical protein
MVGYIDTSPTTLHLYTVNKCILTLAYTPSMKMQLSHYLIRRFFKDSSNEVLFGRGTANILSCYFYLFVTEVEETVHEVWVRLDHPPTHHRD